MGGDYPAITKRQMRTTKQDRFNALMGRMLGLGFMPAEARALLSIQSALHRWDEAECGLDWGHIERDDAGKPWRVIHRRSGADFRSPCRDMEKAALRRLESIAKEHSEVWFYHQSDCRGCALYVGKKDGDTERSLEALYTRGIAVCF
jgi:hypothetical protein